MISLPVFIAILLFSVFISYSFSSQKTISTAPKTERLYYLVPILLFHNVDGFGPFSLTRQEFRKYLDVIKNENIRVISLRELYEHAITNTLLEKPSVVITIDDNYTNIVRVLAPILREYGFHATFFFYTNMIYPHPMFGSSWEDLKRLLQEGFDIQNHSHTHTIFHIRQEGQSEADFRNKLYQEMVYSKKIFEEKLNHKIWAFAYPMGLYTEELHKYAFENGYQLVLTTDAKPVDLTKKFEGVMRRYTIHKFENRDNFIEYKYFLSFSKIKITDSHSQNKK
ncbi:MAG: polysaccharide deacetylase family protein [Leptospiraceae bacterium]|nr:polysaccharide deacetylase family protein [Leptospiraceae bacterium]